ncbi:MAG TPA: phasin family protein, partial [Burkholderiaceae bacterium]
MSKKTAKPAAKAAKPTQSGTTVIDSAQQIWAAGLAAYDKARGKRSKAFDKLVQDGLTLQKKAQSAVQEKAGAQWDKLEAIFERRVAQALQSLGTPTAAALAALSQKIDALAKAVQQNDQSTARPKAAAKKVAKKA